MAARAADVTSRIMRVIRGKDSRAELAFRRALFSTGVRFRKHLKRLPGTPDLAIVSARIAIFIDGDFWHGNSWRKRGLPTLASQFPSNTEFWVNKIERNMARDKKVTRTLRRQGWSVIRFWESDVLKNTDRCVQKTLIVLEQSRSSSIA